MIPALDIAVTDPTHVAEARRSALRLAQHFSFDDARQGRIALVVTEIATNLLKHAKTGRVVLSAVLGQAAIDAFGLDNGPGISNLAECLRDGYSSAGSSGIGLGAVQRQSDAWDIFSAPGQGTVIRARFALGNSENAASRFETGAVVLPYPGCAESGDAWAVREAAGNLALLVVDGLGHGVFAAEAADAAVSVFRDRTELSGAILMAEIDRALQSTRGAAMALVEIGAATQVLSFTGVGNISGVILAGPVARHLVSINGIVGNRVARPRTYEYPWSEDSVLVLHSDGLRTRWNLNDYRGLAMKSAPLIAGVLMRDAMRGTDDASVVVVRPFRSSHA